MIIDVSQLALFIPAALALNLTPGSDNLYCLGKGLAGGSTAGIVASMGIATGSLIHTLLAAFGLAALLATYPVAFNIVRWVGVAYLLWLGIKALQTPVLGNTSASKGSESLLRIWFDGTLVNLFNPKVAIFILAFIPQFIDSERGSTAVQFVIFGSILNVMGTLVAGTVGAFSGSIGHQLAHNKFLSRAMPWITATVFIGLAVKLALDRS